MYALPPGQPPVDRTAICASIERSIEAGDCPSPGWPVESKGSRWPCTGDSVRYPAVDVRPGRACLRTSEGPLAQLVRAQS